MDEKPDLPFDKPESFKPTEFILFNNENVIPLNS